MTIWKDIYTNIFAQKRYLLYAEGLKNTLLIALIATLIGVFIGIVIAIVKVYARTNKKLKPLEILADIYLTIIRGTPMMIQLMIMYFIVFASAPIGYELPIAMLAFGINSGAYVAEIFRAGIQSIDPGQMEAGRSLGLSRNKTMIHIILPQAIRNILPALFNEFIVLIKETSIVGIIAVRDLTKVTELIRSRTLSAYVSLIFAAIIYLILVTILTIVQRKLERRLGTNDRR